MAKQTVDSLIEGGKASAAPPLGPALGPLGVNIGEIVAAINEKTKDFKGMQVPIKVVVDTDTKAFEISVGTPPASQLIKSEANVKKGSGNPLADKVADLKIEQIIKIAKMKEDALLGTTPKARAKEIIGTCNSMGILVEGVPAIDAGKLVDEGKFDEKIASGKTELTAEELKQLEEEKKHLAEEMEKKREEYTAKAKDIIGQLKGRPRSQIKGKLIEAEIPLALIDELLPDEEAKAEGGDAPAAAPEEAK
jgi:large subunit ribosomal protein L11